MLQQRSPPAQQWNTQVRHYFFNILLVRCVVNSRRNLPVTKITDGRLYFVILRPISGNDNYFIFVYIAVAGKW